MASKVDRAGILPNRFGHKRFVNVYVKLLLHGFCKYSSDGARDPKICTEIFFVTVNIFALARPNGHSLWKIIWLRRLDRWWLIARLRT